MPYAVELFFDRDLVQQLRRLRADLAAEVGAPDRLAQQGVRPHISLAFFDQGDVPRLLASLQILALEQEPFALDLAGLQTFPGAEGVLYLAPQPQQSLTLLQARCQRAMHDISQDWSPFYRSGSIVFHCTMGLGWSAAQIQQGLNEAANRIPTLQGKVLGIGLVDVASGEVLGDFLLGRQA